MSQDQHRRAGRALAIPEGATELVDVHDLRVIGARGRAQIVTASALYRANQHRAETDAAVAWLLKRYRDH